MKHNKKLPFLNKKILSALQSESPFFLEGFDFRLLPLVLPFLQKKGLIFYNGPSGPIYSGLLLFIGECCSFYDRDFLSKEVSLEGFRGFLNEGRELFISSLRDSFKNHSYVLFPEDVFNKKVFNSYVGREGFVLDQKTSYSSLVSRLKGLGYQEQDFVGGRGDFALRGMVVDFFPFGYSVGVRAVFEGELLSALFMFNINTQLVLGGLSFFHLESAQTIKKKVSLSSLLSKKDFSSIYLVPGGVCFFKKTPSISFSSPFSSLSLLDGLSRVENFSFFDSPCMVSFSLDKKVFVPLWAKKQKGRDFLSGDAYVDFSQLEVGDFLVHSDFGVGKYLGMSFSNKGEGLILGFKDTKINVFPSYFKKLSFYRRGGSLVQEDFIGKGSLWKGRVSLAKRAAALVAEELVKSFAIRKKTSSDVYYLDEALEEPFLKGFPFKDTVDQGVVWDEIKKDLLSQVPMERLLCGDVGFGKTELAIRSCFVSSINGFSSVVLAPTTILTKQLVASFRSRLSPFGIQVGEVSRLLSAKKQKENLKGFLSGKIDILIGTHKISFEKEVLKKTSLVVVDDEHRFGVKDKENIFSINPSSDVLMMSATPLPRTLQMSLSKIKNISLLKKPPLSRKPIITNLYVFNNLVFKKILLQEFLAGGQIYVVDNSVYNVLVLYKKISQFLHTDNTILYTSCFDANGGLFETLLDSKDAIISDALNHASIIDGIRLCKAERYRFANSNMDELESILKKTQAARTRLIATDGIFSMDGYVAKLETICNLADKYNSLVMVDDSHATGFFGARGRGSIEHCEVMGRVDIITSTLGKALGGASGGFSSGRQEIIDILRQRSRPYLFSNTLAPAIVATSIAVIDMLSTTTELRDKLDGNTKYFREKMTNAGFNIQYGVHPIVPIMLGDAKLAQNMAVDMLSEGIYVIGFSFPVVPKGKARSRVQLSAAHTRNHLDKAIYAFIKIGKKYKVLK